MRRLFDVSLGLMCLAVFSGNAVGTPIMFPPAEVTSLEHSYTMGLAMGDHTVLSIQDVAVAAIPVPGATVLAGIGAAWSAGCDATEQCEAKDGSTGFSRPDA